jgi:hypothetical protein
MKRVSYAVTTAVFALTLAFSSCSKLDWKKLKDPGGVKFPIDLSDCDVKRVYTLGETGDIHLEMKKTYSGDGRVKTIGFYTFSAVGPELYWHSFSLSYNAIHRTIDFIDSASGEAVLKAMFNHSGRLERLKRLQGDTSDYADRRFEYSGGRLTTIYSRWKTFDDVETFTYDTNGNIVRRVVTDVSGITEEEAVYTYGAAATDKKQFYIPQYNYMIVSDPSMALLEYLGWIKDFSPKNILTGIQYLAPLPGEETYTGHVFDAGGKLTSYSNGDWAGGRKYIDWRCSE